MTYKSVDAIYDMLDTVSGKEKSPVMTTKRWVLVDFGECIECGDCVEILTECEDEGFFFDGDKARCCNCGLLGQFNCDSETPGYISWHEEI